MKNYLQQGDIVDAVAPYALASGDGALVGTMFGVAAGAASSGAAVRLKVEGVFRLTALSTDTATAGAAAYWDNTNKRITTTTSGNTKIGVFTADKANGDTTADVRLNGAF